MTLKRRASRNNGATLGLAVALAMVLVLIALGLFALSMLFGAQKEAKTAGDAGALNVGKQVLTMTVPLVGDEIIQFWPPGAPDNAPIPPTASIDSVGPDWGQAYLVGLNAQQMQDINALGTGGIDAKKVHDDVDALTVRLLKQLNNPDNLSQFYTDYAAINSVRMLGSGNSVQVPSTANWSQSYLDTGYESNCWISPLEIPIFSFDQAPIPTITPKNDPKQYKYFIGYQPYTAMNMNYWWVPFRFGERTHLISQSQFDASKSTVPNSWSNALPNAFSTIGTTAGNNQSKLLASACVQTNTPHVYPAQIPWGTIKVVYHRNVINWVVNGVQVQTGTYLWPYTSGTLNAQGKTFLIYDDKDFGPYPIPCGTVSAHEYLGREYLNYPDFTYLNWIYALTPNDYMTSQLWKNIVQRYCEVMPYWDERGCYGLFHGWYTSDESVPPSDADKVYIMTPNTGYVNMGSDPVSQIEPEPDGTAVLLETEPTQVSPNYGTATITCAGKDPQTVATVTMEEGERWWTPGTGYVPGPHLYPCLGRIDIKRTTTVYIFAF